MSIGKRWFKIWCSWLENSNEKRLAWANGYLVFGSIFIFITEIFGCDSLISHLFWVFGWSGIGIGAGLINSREKRGSRDKQAIHYLLYFGFALIVSSLAALALAMENGTLNLAKSAFIGLISGFSSERLKDLAKKEL